MATWKLSPQYKKSAVEKMFFYKDGKCITIEQGFRWATFSVQSDERPLTDDELKNEDGYELGSIENDESWEMWDMTDGCWLEIEAARDNTTSTDVEEFEAAWEEDSYEGVEALGWSQDDCEYYYYGPLELTNEDTGEVFQGESYENVSVSGVPHTTNTNNPIDFPSPELAFTEQPELTDWFPVSVKPAYKGSYEILTTESTNWPFPQYVEWNGNWNTTEAVTEWRGLAKDPSK
jgi:hypothetical protein